MPWRNTCAMDERTRFVLEAEGDNIGHFTELCARYGISRKTGYKWLDRYKEGGIATLEDQSRAPKTHPNEVSEETKQAILDTRRAHATWGPKKIRELLKRADESRSWPAISTIGEILKSNGLSISR